MSACCYLLIYQKQQSLLAVDKYTLYAVFSSFDKFKSVFMIMMDILLRNLQPVLSKNYTSNTLSHMLSRKILEETTVLTTFLNNMKCTHMLKCSDKFSSDIKEII